MPCFVAKIEVVAGPWSWRIDQQTNEYHGTNAAKGGSDTPQLGTHGEAKNRTGASRSGGALCRIQRRTNRRFHIDKKNVIMRPVPSAADKCSLIRARVTSNAGSGFHEASQVKLMQTLDLMDSILGTLW
jgi:hypothetical protein